MSFNCFPLAVKDWSGFQIGFSHSETCFNLKELMVGGDNLIVGSRQIRNVSLNSGQCVCFLNQFTVQTPFPGFYRDKPGTVGWRLATDNPLCFGNLFLNIFQV